MAGPRVSMGQAGGSGMQVGPEHPLPLLVSHFFMDSSWTWKPSEAGEDGRASKPGLADQGSSDSAAFPVLRESARWYLTLYTLVSQAPITAS